MFRTTMSPRTALPPMVLALCAGAALGGDLALPPLFTSGMVVQREQPIVIWGEADAGDTVRVSLGGETARVTAGDDGAWEATLPAMDAGGPHEIVVTDGDDTLTLGDVLVGDVWVCSGQSNMYWALGRTDRAAEFVAQDGPDQLRLFRVNKVWSRTPENVVDAPGWWHAEPDKMEWFSAVGYHFGRVLHEETGVPIGLLETAWGGTPAEAWTPMETFEAAPEFYADRLASLDEYDVDDEEAARLVGEAQAEHEAFVALAWREDIGEERGWHEPGFDDSGWGTVEMPGYIDGELGSFNGVVWLRRTFELSGEPGAGTLHLGRIDDFDTAYINGERVGRTSVDQGDGRRIERHYDIPEGVLKRGENSIAIALMDVRSSGGVTPDGKPFEVEAGSETAELTGDWKYKVGFDGRAHGGFPLPGDYAVPVGRAYRRPAALYNAMVHPFTRSGVRGVIWYQGESNSGRGDEYRRMFPEMIMAWRDAWKEGRGDRSYGLPFYFVQLPNYRAAKDQPSESSWAELREAQRLTEQNLPRTGMAITIDVGDPGDIHPTNKLPVGERLARHALANEYGVDVGQVTGPRPVGISERGGVISVRFDNAGGLHAKGGEATAFAVAGRDGKFEWADAEVRGDTVVIRRPAGLEGPVRVRYGWADNPPCTLFNGDGLPATPFELTVE